MSGRTVTGCIFTLPIFSCPTTSPSPQEALPMVRASALAPHGSFAGPGQAASLQMPVHSGLRRGAASCGALRSLFSIGVCSGLRTTALVGRAFAVGARCEESKPLPSACVPTPHRDPNAALVGAVTRRCSAGNYAGWTPAAAPRRVAGIGRPRSDAATARTTTGRTQRRRTQRRRQHRSTAQHRAPLRHLAAAQQQQQCLRRPCGLRALSALTPLPSSLPPSPRP